MNNSSLPVVLAAVVLLGAHVNASASQPRPPGSTVLIPAQTYSLEGTIAIRVEESKAVVCLTNLEAHIVEPIPDPHPAPRLPRPIPPPQFPPVIWVPVKSVDLYTTNGADLLAAARLLGRTTVVTAT